MSNHVWPHFIEPMLLVFDDPPGSNTTAFFEALADDLGMATQHQLAEAAKHFRRTRKARTFPTIADCVEAVHAQPAAPTGPIAPAAKVTPAHGRHSPNDPWSREREALADTLLRGTAIGHRAAEAGWLMVLWDWCRNNQRLPNHGELRRIEQDALGYLDRRDAPLPDLVRGLGELMRKREEGIQRRLFPSLLQEAAE